ncbi:hypothetical protein V5735_13005 (plasmid) [Haladaptatus sp. SPP-AMP-3]|uniref:DUF6884 domain-containing protein n=1 Tax=Haladaptatus sp. SPP-AMP-3 TaxID=3121295 RepID=UPI003C302ABE
MSILVISACSGSKKYDAEVGQQETDAKSRVELLAEVESTASAREMYTGREHQHVRSAVEQLEQVTTVDWHIISAGLGLVRSDESICSYECTFSGKSKGELRERAIALGIQPDGQTKDDLISNIGDAKGISRDLLALGPESYDYVLFVLGREYFMAANHAVTNLPDSTNAIAFASEANRKHIGNCRWIRSSEQERAELGVAFIELKGQQLLSFVEDSKTLDEFTAQVDRAAN